MTSTCSDTSVYVPIDMSRSVASSAYTDVEKIAGKQSPSRLYRDRTDASKLSGIADVDESSTAGGSPGDTTMIEEIEKLQSAHISPKHAATPLYDAQSMRTGHLEQDNANMIYNARLTNATSPKDAEKMESSGSGKKTRPSKQLWIISIIITVFVIGAIAGAVVGTIKKNRDRENRLLDPFEKYSSTQLPPSPTFTPLPLELGPWEIVATLDSETGICGNHPQSIFSCADPLLLNFNLIKVPGGYRTQGNGKIDKKNFKAPQGPEDWWTIGIFEDNYPVPVGGRECRTTVNVTVQIRPAYQYYIQFHYMNPTECVIGNGYKSEPGHYCHCEWTGYVYDTEYKIPGTTSSGSTFTTTSTTDTATDTGHTSTLPNEFNSHSSPTGA